MAKAGRYMVGVLILALAVTLAVGNAGLDIDKIAGIGLASLTVLPVFYILIRAMRSRETKTVLKTFIGGFFYKLIVLMAGIWLGLVKAGWDVTDFTVGCLSFVFAYQVCESLYFWVNREIVNQSQTT